MRTLMLIAPALTLTASSVATAQSYSETGYTRSESQIGLGLTIPFSRGKAVDREPRVELGVSRNRVDYSGHRMRVREPMRLALTLGPNQRLMMNGRVIQGPLDDEGKRHKISTLGGVAIGVGAILVIGAVIVATKKCEPNLLGTC
jgi:hypothetical protein